MGSLRLPVGTAAGRNVATEEDAWTDFYPQEADRESAQKQGYRWELMTHDRWSAEVADRMIAGCPHVGPAAKPGTGRGPDRDKPAVPELAAEVPRANQPHVRLQVTVPQRPPADPPAALVAGNRAKARQPPGGGAAMNQISVAYPASCRRHSATPPDDSGTFPQPARQYVAPAGIEGDGTMTDSNRYTIQFGVLGGER